METTIEVHQLSKAYGALQAVQQISFSVHRGEVFGILGANGAGKSTTIECILGTRKRDSGTVSILGMDPHQDRHKLFQHVGVQFQETNFQDKIRVSELCESTASLYPCPQDYTFLLDQFGLLDKRKNDVAELSGGQKQRLFIVLALLPDPKVVFLDELTTGLDAKARREVWGSLAKMRDKGLSILLTSHFMDEVEVLCDRIIIIKKGVCV